MGDSGRSGGIQGRCEPKSDFFVKIQKKKYGGGGVVGFGGGGGGQCGSEQRIEVFVKFQKRKKSGAEGGSGWRLGWM